MFYIEFPSSWETQDIYDLFSPFGSIFVAWNDDKSCFVAIQNSDNIKKGNYRGFKFFVKIKLIIFFFD